MIKMPHNQMNIPYVTLDRMAKDMKTEFMGAFEMVLESGQYVMGHELSTFESEFAEFCGTEFAVGIASGTCALHLILRGLGLGEGDEVITVPNSFVSSASSIALNGARPVFVDIDSDLNINPDLIEASVTKRTRAIMPVHFTGRPVRMNEVLDVARKYDLFILEDAAQAVGSSLDGRRTGSWGNAACFSLHPLKNLHAFGDGGIITTSDKKIRDRMMMARNHGLSGRDQCDYWSFNCRLDEVQAAMLRIQLTRLDDWNMERRSLALRYNELLRPWVLVPDEGPGERCTYQTYMIQADDRDNLQRELANVGIQTLVHYPTPLHLQPAARDLGYVAEDFPIATTAARRILSLPLYPGLTHPEQDYIAEAVSGFYRR